MAVIEVLNSSGDRVSEIDLSDFVFNVPVKACVLHDVVKMQLAARRAGSASVKRRSDVSGSTRKLYRQKGTGRARKGDIKSPLLRGGGVIFGPDPRSYAYKLPKKVKKLALKMALSSKYQANNIVVINKIDLDQIKTKDFVGIVKALKVKNALIVTDAADEKLNLSSRNVQNVKIMRSEGLNVYDILKYENLILLEPSIKQIEGRLLS
jgi:large subunit ribosomal protein L4